MDTVIHLGALMVRPPTVSETLFWNINVLGTLLTVRAAARARVKRYILGSSDASYSALIFDYLPVDENHPLKPNHLYGLTKQVGEAIVFETWRETCLPVTVLRFGSVVAGEEILDKFTVRGAYQTLKNTATKPGSCFHVQAIERPWEPLEHLMDKPQQKLIPRGPDLRSWRAHMTDVRDTVNGTMLALESDDAVAPVLGYGFTAYDPYAAPSAETGAGPWS